MTTPSQFLRDLREQQTSRRLGVAKALRETPNATNIELGKVFGVTRDTIALDRKALVEQLKQSTVTETEQLRAEMVGKLEHLNTELELHRTDGKLPVSVIHEALLVTRSIIELLGVRKPVVEKLQVSHKPIRFNTTIVSTEIIDGQRVGVASPPKLVEFTRKQLTLEAGDQHEDR